MKYQEILDYLEEKSSIGIVPGLSSEINLCARLGNPQNKLKFVHIAGTNGKGSTLAYVSTICQESGLKIGRYLSPTIRDYRERFQVNGKMITKKDFCEGMTLVIECCIKMVAEGYNHPSPFEMETSLAFWYFAKKECDLVILETGLGGRYDATNVIENSVIAVITSISMDHMQFLGKSIREIAREKAGIIKKGCLVVTTKQQEDAMKVICEEAELYRCPVYVSDDSQAVNVKYGLQKQSFSFRGLNDLQISLSGKFQIENACLAVRVIEALQQSGFQINEDAIRKGLRNTVWEGRFSIIRKNPLWIIDGAHNEDAAYKLAQSIETYLGQKRLIFIMGMLKDKEYEKVVALTAKYASHIITITPPENKRALSAIELAKVVMNVNSNVTAADSLEEAVEIADMMANKADVVLTFGSLSFLGKLMNILENR